MIRTLVASTQEIDDTDLAVDELFQQLDLANNLLNNSIGIIACRTEYLETNIISNLSKTLPFDLVGATTILGGSNKAFAPFVFTLYVITSDDAFFNSICIKDINTENFEEKVKESTQDLITKNLKMFLMYAPLDTDLTSDRLLNVIDGLTEETIPVFGQVAISHYPDSSNSMTIFNNTFALHNLVLVAISGNVTPKFTIANVEENHIKKERGLITKSCNNIVEEINGASAISYLENIGYENDLNAEGLSVIPLVLSYPELTLPITRSVFSITKEGWIVLGGDAPMNIPVSISYTNTKDVGDITENELKKHNESEDFHGCLIYSCIARYHILGLTNNIEYEKCKEILIDKNFVFSYSGGEICPIKTKNGKWKNFLHNHSIVMLGF
ncbi:MAG: hypothetical protein LBV53_03070 [Mycoplasmataceae bacterium]|jgi:hypothetical protein|nr:hypothetical protein [Mycoplasmataceae bacterium]